MHASFCLQSGHTYMYWYTHNLHLSYNISFPTIRSTYYSLFYTAGGALERNAQSRKCEQGQGVIGGEKGKYPTSFAPIQVEYDSNEDIPGASIRGLEL